MAWYNTHTQAWCPILAAWLGDRFGQGDAERESEGGEGEEDVGKACGERGEEPKGKEDGWEDLGDVFDDEVHGRTTATL
jgi:hypothetical protein